MKTIIAVISLSLCLSALANEKKKPSLVVVKAKTCKVYGPEKHVPLTKQKEPLLQCEVK